MASYNIEWKHSAIKELKRLEKDVIVRVLQAVKELADNPHSAASRKIRGSQHTYRKRIGDYRIIYSMSKEYPVPYP